MMISAEKAIKNKAKAILSSGWASPIIAMGALLVIIFAFAVFESLTYTIASDFLNYNLEPRIVNNLPENYLIPLSYTLIAELIPVLFLLFMSPFFNGYIKLHYCAIKTGRYEMSDMVYFMNPKRYWKTIALNISYIIRLIIPAFLSFLPPMIFAGCSIVFFKKFTESAAFNVMLVILMILSGIILLMYSLKYFLVFKLYSSDETQKISYYFRTSKQGMSDNTGKVIKLAVSLIPQYLLSLLLLPAVYTVPFITQSYCVSADYLIELKKEKDNYDESIPMYDSL